MFTRAVLDKNFYWYNRYRVTDGYSTYGDRAFLKFSEGPGGYGDGLSNYSVAQRELEVLDLLTSNRDKVVWAAAQGKQIKADDSNLPDLIPVISNKPGPLPGGKHKFLGGEEAIKHDDASAKGMKVSAVRHRGGCSRSWSTRCRWRSTPRAVCGSPPGEPIRTGSPPSRWTTSC